MENLDLDECFKVAQDVARTVGVVIREAFSQEKRVEVKESIADLVTETDQKVENMIMTTFKEKFPSHSFIGEETTSAGVPCVLTDNPTWIVDPIDGTNNFVHRFPYVAVSIALLVKKQCEVAVIFNPILDQMYTARPGQGAYCNGSKLQSTDTQELGKAMLCAEFGSSRDPQKLDSKFRSMRNVINKAHGLRVIGSAALAMCTVACGQVDAYHHHGLYIWDMAAAYLIVIEAGGVVRDTSGSAAVNMAFVASGSADGYYEMGMHVWDIAAGMLIVREAGGVVMDTSGGPLDLMSRRVLCAGTEKLATEIAQTIEQIDFERD